MQKGLKNSLQLTYVNFKTWARANNIYCNISPLSPKIWGYVFKSKSRKYLIIIKSCLTKKMQKEVFCHEVDHIIIDMPERVGFLIWTSIIIT